MTIGQDYPDWQSYANWRGEPLAANPAFALSSANPFSVSAFVTNYQALAVAVGPVGSAGATLTLTYYTDATLDIETFTESWNISSTQAIQMITPILGNYVVAGISTTTAVAHNTAISILPMNTPVPSTRYFAPQNLIQLTGGSLAASSSVIIPLPYIAEGPAWLSFRDRTASGELSVGVWGLNLTGTVNFRLAYYGNPQTEIYQYLIAPAFPLGVEITNSDTVLHTYDYSFNVDGR
jgi:hypothetical protein